MLLSQKCFLYTNLKKKIKKIQRYLNRTSQMYAYKKYLSPHSVRKYFIWETGDNPKHVPLKVDFWYKIMVMSYCDPP